MKNLLNTVERLWCETMHERLMWPIHGRYLCSTCLREYPVAYQDTQAHSHRESPVSTLHVPASASHWSTAPNRS